MKKREHPVKEIGIGGIPDHHHYGTSNRNKKQSILHFESSNYSMHGNVATYIEIAKSTGVQCLPHLEKNYYVGKCGILQ